MSDRSKVSSICIPRHIKGYEKTTPLLLPSFSSTVNDQVNDIFEVMRESLVGGYLVSAYDLHHGVISGESIWNPDIVFVDSGSYEQREIEQLVQRYGLQQSKGDSWDIKKYTAVLDALLGEKPKLGLHTMLVIVNLDRNCPLMKQIHEAKELFKRYPDCVTDFLCKPLETNSKFIDCDELSRNVSLLDSFDIIGFSEKELGASFVERCKSLHDVRTALSKAGSQKPIHIFGCLDPVSIVSFFLCGADIFDGLNWLKYGFKENIAIYKSNYSLSKSSWIMPDERANALQYIENVKELDLLASRMKQYAQDHDPNTLDFQSTTMAPVRALVEAAGLDFR